MVYSADNYKNQEIRDMYYIIYNNRLREGVDEKQAKRIAYDSVSSRFSITNDRIRHILYTKGCNPAYRTFFYTNNREILSNLKELVRHYEGVKKMWVQVEEESGNELSDVLREKIETVNQKILKYHKLIALIEEVNAEYSKQGR